MKKLKLNKTAFAGAEVLSRAQLKKVMGGSEETTGEVSKCEAKCSCPVGYQLKAEYSANGFSAYVTNCTTTCSATDYSGVTCGTASMTCSEAAEVACEKIPTVTV